MIVDNLTLAHICNLGSLGGLTRLFRAVNILLCPHICLGDKEMIKLCNDQVKRRGKTHRCLSSTVKCKQCKTTVVLSVDRDLTKFYIYRYIGRLESPTDPLWLAQSFSSKDPHLDAHCQAFKCWRTSFYDPYRWLYMHRPIPGPPKEFELDVPRPDFDRLFTPVSLLGPARRRGF